MGRFCISAAFSLLLCGAAATTLGGGLDRKCATVCVGAHCNPAVVLGGAVPIFLGAVSPMGGSRDGRWLSFKATSEQGFNETVGVADTTKFTAEGSPDALTYLPAHEPVELQAGPFAPSGEYFWFMQKNRQLCLGYPERMRNNTMAGTRCLPPYNASETFTLIIEGMSRDGRAVLIGMQSIFKNRTAFIVGVATLGEGDELALVETRTHLGSAYLTQDGTRVIFRKYNVNCTLLTCNEQTNHICTGVVAKMTSTPDSNQGITCAPVKNPVGSRGFSMSVSGVNANGTLAFVRVSVSDEGPAPLCLVDTLNGNTLCTQKSYEAGTANGVGNRFAIFTQQLVKKNFPPRVCVTDMVGATGGTGRVLQSGVLGAKYTNCTQPPPTSRPVFASTSPPAGEDDTFVLTTSLDSDQSVLQDYIVSPAELDNMAPIGGKGMKRVNLGKMMSSSYMPLGGWSNRSAIAQWWTSDQSDYTGQICTQKVITELIV